MKTPVDPLFKNCEQLVEISCTRFADENRKQMTTKLMSTSVGDMLEQEVITYCSSTKPSWPNLHFLFSYYLNRNCYVEAMTVHEMLIQQDATSVVEQQRKVITDSALKLIPSIQKTLSSISVDKNATVEGNLYMLVHTISKRVLS
jgi:hypothetical protein